MFVDMAGRIPYVVGIPTDDEAGLVSPAVTSQEEALGPAWLAAFLSERRPTWVVLRGPLEERVDVDGTRGPSGEAVIEAYELARHFVYEPAALAGGDLSGRLARLGTGPDFFVYRLRTPRVRPPRR
jgi:hypothetical protein